MNLINIPLQVHLHWCKIKGLYFYLQISLCYVELVLDHQLNTFETSSNIHHIHGAAHPKKKPSLNPSHSSAPFTESMVFLRYMSLIVLDNDHERAIATLRGTTSIYIQYIHVHSHYPILHNVHVYTCTILFIQCIGRK